MKIQKITVKNFLSHKDTELELPDGFIGILGHNGSGKSSLIKDSITWALWGRARVGGAGDDLIREGTNECCVSVSVEVNSVTYHITRTRTKEVKTSLALCTDTTDLSRPVLRATQEEINKILGMNYDVFVNSCCIEQGEADSFSKLTPSQAAILISSVLQLDFYSECKKKASNICVTSKMAGDKLDMACGYLEEKIKEHEQIEEIIAKSKEDLESKEEALKLLEAQYEKTQTQYNKEYQKWQDNSSSVRVIEAEIKSINSSLEKLNRQATVLQDVNGECPVCNTKLTEACKAAAKESILHEYEDLLDKKTSLETDLNTKKANHKSVMQHLQNYKLEDKRTKIKAAHTVLENLKGEVKALEGQIVNISELKDKLKSNLEKVKGIRKTEQIYSDLASAFSPKGIPLMIIDSVLDELEVLINENIKLLSNLPISVSLRTQRESTKGEMLDTFQIMIMNGRCTRGYFNYSGGQKLIIDLAIRLGLSELLARRNNFKVETLIIDEGLGSLDEENQRNLINTLKKLKDKFSNILVVTHTQAKDYFVDILELELINGISVLDKQGSVWYNNNSREKTI